MVLTNSCIKEYTKCLYELELRVRKHFSNLNRLDVDIYRVIITRKLKVDIFYSSATSNEIRYKELDIKDIATPEELRTLKLSIL